jgi:hypothetical protein
MRAAFGARFGGQGRGGRGGQEGGSRFNREEMLKQFDKDGDGQLSEEERAAMRQGRGSRSENRDGERPSGPRTSEPGSPQPVAEAERPDGATR